MAFEFGKPPPEGAGRPPGAANRATKTAREAIAMFVDGNAHRLCEWLDKIAEDNPLAAFDRFMSVVEYHIPKLQRSEVTGKDGKDLFPVLSDEQMLERIKTIMLARNNVRAGQFAEADRGGSNVIEGTAIRQESRVIGTFGGEPETQTIELQAIPETDTIP